MVSCMVLSWATGQKYENPPQLDTEWLPSLRTWCYFIILSFICSGYNLAVIKKSHTLAFKTLGGGDGWGVGWMGCGSGGSICLPHVVFPKMYLLEWRWRPVFLWLLKLTIFIDFPGFFPFPCYKDTNDMSI